MILLFPEFSIIKIGLKVPIGLIYTHMQYKASESWSFKNPVWQAPHNLGLNCQQQTVVALAALGIDMKIRGMYLLPEKDSIL